MDEPAPHQRPDAQQQTATKPRTKRPRSWNVVLLDDQDHSYDYVIRMMQELFHHPQPKAYQIAKQVDQQGRAVCLTTHREHAELKRDQILAYGKDPRIEASAGSMSSVIEPADFGGDDDAADSGGEAGKP